MRIDESREAFVRVIDTPVKRKQGNQYTNHWKVCDMCACFQELMIKVDHTSLDIQAALLFSVADDSFIIQATTWHDDYNRCVKNTVIHFLPCSFVTYRA